MKIYTLLNGNKKNLLPGLESHVQKNVAVINQIEKNQNFKKKLT
ncbi:MAG: hypothetical protein WDO71_26995 [Bacteroidota bacterium]